MHRDVSVLHACMVKKVAYYGPGSINPIAVSQRGAGKIDLRKSAVLVKDPWPLPAASLTAALNQLKSM